MPSHHEVLGVRKDAGRREINAAYRRLAKRHHPDVTGGDAATFQRITEAYQILKTRPAPEEASEPDERLGNFPDERAKGSRMGGWLRGFLRRRAHSLLAVAFFALGLFLLDWGDGIHEDFNVPLLVLGSAAVLLAVGFFANRRQAYEDFADALLRSASSILFFLFDALMRVYLVLVLVFSVVALLALINWLKKHYLHLLPHHF